MFQPIVALAGGAVVGYEALSRGPAGHRLEGAPALLEAAASAGLSVEVERRMVHLARARAWRRFRNLELLLFVNAPPPTGWDRLMFRDPAEEPQLWPWSRTVVEVTERSPIERTAAFTRLRTAGRRRGARFALDDAGAGYAGLAALALLAPAFVKIDLGLVRGCDRSPHRRDVIAALVHYGHDTGSTIIGEGIETADELRTLVELGVDAGQGYLFARPAEIPPTVPAGRSGRRA